MYSIRGVNMTGRNLTDDEIAAFCALEKEEIEKLIPDERFLDYVARKTPQGYFRIMVSYREVSIIAYILDPHYGTTKMTKSWRQDIQLFAIRALKQTLLNGILLSQKEIKYLYDQLSKTNINSNIFNEIMRIVFYLPEEYRQKFVSAARMASYHI